MSDSMQQDRQWESIEALEAMAGSAAAEPAEPAAAEPTEELTEAARVQRVPSERAVASAARRVQMQQYKRTMIPLMLVVGALLLGLSALTVLMLTRQPAPDPNQAQVQKTLIQQYGVWAVAAAAPLGAALLAGAWWFHREVRSAGS